MTKQLIGVIGGQTRNTTPAALRIAERVGFEIGRRGMSVICGGYDGIMEAACRGCRAGGGLTIAILKGSTPTGVNGYVDIAIPTSMDVACNNIIVWASAGLVAFDGRYGTLNEIALALDFDKPLVVVGNRTPLHFARVDAPRFRHFARASATHASHIVDTLMTLIEEHR